MVKIQPCVIVDSRLTSSGVMTSFCRSSASETGVKFAFPERDAAGRVSDFVDASFSDFLMKDETGGLENLQIIYFLNIYKCWQKQ